MATSIRLAALLLTLLVACTDADPAPTPAPSPTTERNDVELQRQTLADLGITIDYPPSWIFATPPMPYATCNECLVIGPRDVTHPYGIQFWTGEHQVGCELFCYINIRALPQEATRRISANGHVAFQQEFERQRPLGDVNEDGDNTSYREILTVVPVQSVEALPPEAFVSAVFIDAFYRYGDAAGEAQTRAALAALLESLAIDP